MPRTWASGDNVFLPIGGLVGIGSSPNTLVAIAKRASDGAWMTPTAIQPSAGNPTVSMQVSSTNKLSYVSGATDKDTGITWQASDGWSLIAVDKAGGTATPNGHLYVYGTDTWTHSAAGSTVGGNSTDLTGGKVQHGRWATGDPFIGDIAIAGIWKRQLGQTEIEYLAFSLQQWYAAAPDYLVIFDQAATSQNVIDLITGNTEQSHSGASIGTSSVPVFSYGFAVPVPSFVASAGGGDATVTPSTVAAVAAVPSATVSAGSTVTPATVAAVAAVPTATIATGSTVAPTVVAAVAAVPSAGVSAGSTVLAATVQAVAAVPAATVSTGSTVLAAMVAAVSAVPTPSITAGGATIAATTVTVTAAVPLPSVRTGSTVLPSTVIVIASVPAPTVVVPAAGLVGEAHGPESLPTGAITTHSVGLAGGVT